MLCAAGDPLERIMLTGYNTDVRHLELVLHVQTEDKGLDNPAIESVIYLRGRVLAAKRTAYDKLINQGKGEREIAALMEHQHRTIVAASVGASTAGSAGGHRGPAATAARRGADQAIRSTPRPGAPDGSRPRPGREKGPSSTGDSPVPLGRADQEHLVLVLDSHGDPRRTPNNLTLRAYSSKSGLPVAGVQVAVKMLSTVADPRTLLLAETDGVGSLEFQLDVPRFDHGSMALVISGASDLGRAEIKQLL
jgi:hypothetical protein